MFIVLTAAFVGVMQPKITVGIQSGYLCWKLKGEVKGGCVCLETICV